MEGHMHAKSSEALRTSYDSDGEEALDDGRLRRVSTTNGDEESVDSGDGSNNRLADPTPSDESTYHRTPFYDYAAEKYDSHADAKLIYQRHRLESESKAVSPLLLAKSATLPTFLDGDSAVPGFNRTASLASRASNRSQISSAKPQSPILRHEPFPPLDTRDAALAADEQARSHTKHPNLPHEYKDFLLAKEGVHGAGAGVGIGSGPGGFAPTEASINTEIGAICTKIKSLLDLRHKFVSISLQCPGDNPKDDESWEIYPSPPEPVWSEDKARPTTDQAGDGQDGQISTTPGSPIRKRRKAGQAIGEDFDMSEVDIPGSCDLDFKIDDEGVYQVYEMSPDLKGGLHPLQDGLSSKGVKNHARKAIVQVPNLREYYMAIEEIHAIVTDGPAKSFAYRRLQYLEGRYNLYALLNEYEEVAETKKVPHRDFYNVRKVDTHVHHSACMNQKHLLRFIKSKMKKSPNEVVLCRDGKELTLKEVFESINLTAYDLSIDTLDMHAHTDSFHRFDKFNLKYNPVGQSRLREIFLKTDNYIKGRYLAEVTREVISDLESSKYQMVEWRISIYGRSISEWDKLAAWVIDNKLLSNNVRWLIQVPRLYSMYKATNTVESFEDVVSNIFKPLFEVTRDPQSHPKLHVFLHRVIGFDSVDDESKVERRFVRKFETPKRWTSKENPPYSYWIYYLFANMTSLNAFRKRRGFNTFLLRPHCGEAGDPDHLISAMLCCHSISHGITLRKMPILQYVFYLEQIGIAMSPLSNNALFLTYDRNPFVSYFRKGLNVSLSTDDPLQFAFTKEPLIEEYSVAAQIYKFSPVDMCELAKHSVDQSGFELSQKQRWLGKLCYLPGPLGNDVAKCNVPDLRESFRHETLCAEHAFIARFTQDETHLQRCDPVGTAASVAVGANENQASALLDDKISSPRTYYANTLQSGSILRPGPDSAHHNPASHTGGEHQLDNSTNRSPKTDRHQSFSTAMLQSAARDAGYTHIAGTREPRMIPGLVHDQHRREGTRRSTMGSAESAAAAADASVRSAMGRLAQSEELAIAEASQDGDSD
ncbi:MAG: hypothetical protein Q9227_005408 [Pyrenula ochraceoflavens]